jgi:hypothetical protein
MEDDSIHWILAIVKPSHDNPLIIHWSLANNFGTFPAFFSHKNFNSCLVGITVDSPLEIYLGP